MFDWDDLRYFLAIHRRGTLTQAADRLGVNPTTVGRRLTSLEDTLATRLFDRTPTGFSATPAGLRLVPTAERIEADLLALERDIAGRDQKLEGVVRLATTEMLATRFLSPELPALRAQYPDIRVEILCTTRQLDLGRREADVSLRLSRPAADHLIIKRLAPIHLGLYAAHGYFAKTPADAPTPEHALVGFAEMKGFARENDWLEATLPGVRVAMRSTSVSSVYAACVAGLGLALLPRAVADRDPGLAPWPTPHEPEPRWIWQAVHEDMHTVARVRAVLDFLGRVLRV